MSERRSFGGLGGKDDGIRTYKLVVTESHWDVKHSLKDIVNSIAITSFGARWVLETLGGPLDKVYGFLTTILYT